MAKAGRRQAPFFPYEVLWCDECEMEWQHLEYLTADEFKAKHTKVGVVHSEDGAEYKVVRRAGLRS